MGPLNHPQGKVARALPKLTLWRFMQVHCPMALSSQRCRRYWKIIERALQREAQRAELGVGGDSTDAEQGLVGAVQISPGRVQGTIPMGSSQVCGESEVIVVSPADKKCDGN